MIEIILLLAITGFALWLLNTYVPMKQPFPAIINFVVVICALIYLVRLVGGSGALHLN